MRGAAVCAAACLAALIVALSESASDAAARRRGCRSLRQDEGSCPVLLDTSVPVPVTQRIAHELAPPPGVNAPPRVDNYFWLRSDARNDTAVLSHLQEENAYAEAVLAPSLALQEQLLAEMLARVPREEASVPQRRGRHWYYSVHGAGKQYRRYCRRPLDDPAAPPSEHDAMNATAPEEVLLDQDELAGNGSYFDMAGPELSLDEGLLAYGVDAAGGEVYTLHVRNLTASLVVLDGGNAAAYGVEFRSCAGDFVFLNDNRTLLFTTLTPDTHRPDKVWAVDLLAGGKGGGGGGGGRASPASPRLLHHEPDEAFHLSLWRSRSDAVVYLRAGSDTTHHLLYLNASAPPAALNFTTLAPKERERQYVVRDTPAGLLYAVVYTSQERNGRLVVARLGPSALANVTGEPPIQDDDAAARGGESGIEEAGSAASPAAAPSGDAGGDGGEGGAGDAGSSPGTGWALLQAHSREVEIVDLALSGRHLAVLERRNGTLAATAYTLPADGSPLADLRDGRRFGFDAPSFSLQLGEQGPFASPLLRVRYSSLVQPLSTYDINLNTGNRVLKQQQEVVGYEGGRYAARLLAAPSTDGAAVPVSLAYRGDRVALDGTDPLLLEAYGAYGSSFDPEFSGAQLSLLDRGFICAIAHVRGGGELGRYWHEEGRLLAKNHTFDDLAAAAQLLIQNKYTSADRLAVWGRSAGGLTVGATLNRRPELFQAAILDVPFVDVVTTMSDPSLPLTVPEWEEWGDPVADAAAYANMLSYSPLDNVAAGPYPHLMLTGGLNDPRVGYWEPAKLAAKIRELKSSAGSLVLLRTNMAAGHFAASGLEGRLREQAQKYAFLLQTAAPCAQTDGDRAELAARCRGCFAALVAAATTVALVTLVLVLRPSSRFARNWRRLSSWAGQPRRRGLSDDDGDDGDEEGGGAGYDTRLYPAHLTDAEAASAAGAEMERRLRAQQQQLEAQGLKLAAYGEVREAVRDRLLPIPAPPANGVPRLNLGSGVAEPGGIELSAVPPQNGSARKLPAITEAPVSPQSPKKPHGGGG